MVELSAILCHQVFPSNHSSFYAMPAVHIVDIDHARGKVPFFISMREFPDPEDFADARSATCGLLIAHSYYSSKTYQERGYEVGVFNVNPFLILGQPLKEQLTEENEMFQMTPLGAQMKKDQGSVPDYELAELHRIAQFSGTYFKHFKNKLLDD